MESQIPIQVMTPAYGSYTIGPVHSPSDLPSETEHPIIYPSEKLWCSSSIEFNNMCRSWPWSRYSIHDDWTKWCERVELVYGDVWKQAGIYKSMQFFKMFLPVNLPMMRAAACFWCRADNTFHFAHGPMTPTLLDIKAICGLDCLGMYIDPRSSADKTVDDFSSIVGQEGKSKSIYGYGMIIKMYMDLKTPVDEDEHIRFLVVWLSRYIFCSSAFSLTREYYAIAIALSKGENVALSSLMFSSFCVGMENFLDDGGTIIQGPIWLLQIWLTAYFPNFASYTESPALDELYGCFVARQPYQLSYFNDIFSRLYNKEFGLVPDYLVFCTKELTRYPHVGPNAPKILEEHRKVWANYLTPRDIPVGLKVTTAQEVSKRKPLECGVRFYAPHYVARQFGLVQSIPRYGQSLSVRNQKDVYFVEMEVFSDLKEKWRIACQGFVFKPYRVVAFTSTEFNDWWSGYLIVTRSTPLHSAFARYKVANLPDFVVTDTPFATDKPIPVKSLTKKGINLIISRFERFYDVVWDPYDKENVFVKAVRNFEKKKEIRLDEAYVKHRKLVNEKGSQEGIPHWYEFYKPLGPQRPLIPDFEALIPPNLNKTPSGQISFIGHFDDDHLV